MKRNLFITGIACTIPFLTGCKDDDSPNLRIEAESNIQVECKKDTINIPVFCNMPSKATITYDSPDKSGWIFLLPSVLNGDGIFTLWIDEYSNVLEDRTATFLVTAGDETKEIHITQLAKPSLATEPANIAPISNNAGDYQVKVLCKGTWQATVNREAASWCTLKNDTGEGVGNITIHLSEVSDNEMRMATITVSSGNLSSDITIQQGFGIEINGLIWAKSDVAQPGYFAASPDTKGLLYQYDSAIGYPNTSPKEDNNKPNGFRTGAYDDGIPSWRAEKNPCPEGWRIPEYEEIQRLTGNSGNPYFIWAEPTNSHFLVPGAIVGIPREEAALANKDNMRGAIFWPQSGFRDRDSGAQIIWWPANITSITRPGQTWDRYICWIGADNSISNNEFAGNAAAYPVRCVANKK